jgi:tetratricopeptide (TPR) repeat protein
MKTIKVACLYFLLGAIGFGSLFALSGDDALAQAMRRQSASSQSQSAPGPRSPAAQSSAAPVANKATYFRKVQTLLAAKQYLDASRLLFQMSRNPMFKDDATKIKYALGSSLYELKLYQAAAFVFYDILSQESQGKKDRYFKESLQKLSLAANALDSDILLHYAIRKLSENEFPAANRDMLYFRTGELNLDDKKFIDAATSFGRVRPSSPFYFKSKYNQGLALAEAKENDRAVAAFEELIEAAGPTVTNRNRVDALLGKARVLYQQQKWDESTEVYREVPRDTEQWHEALFESSWSLLRAAKFRSALSNFQSLHSPYYEDFYQPESLLLRGIVYLYICRYEEMEKTLDLFERIYKPVQSDVREALEGDRDSILYFKELARVSNNLAAMKARAKNRDGLKIPFLVARNILKEGDVSKTFSYLRKLEVEKKRISSFPLAWRSAPIGKYVQRISDKRIEATRALAGKQIRRHLILIQNDLRDFFEQASFMRYEMINGKKESVKKEIVGKSLPHNKVDDQEARNFYIQNGYEYWPFKGEYWLDEIGNYHYVGVQACE